MSKHPSQLDFLSALTPAPNRAEQMPTAKQRRGAVAYQTGQMAEHTAMRAYRNRGARILETRYRVREGEIDLIVELDGTLVFCEVKSRRTLEQAAHAITSRQWQRLERAANRYMMERNVGAATDMRFDAILMDRTGMMEVVENAHGF